MEELKALIERRRGEVIISDASSELRELIAPDPSLGPYYPHNRRIKY